ncbi:sensor histidine kinase [Tellurirhabdus rosea]|uniref:sensor histidine kinase n=1 Tax=Tellurirhabdus rosea TaxID=2674997 RepID=UPI00225A4850|nr:histidine kinase [Tellurirhabdus rosea]
MTTVSANIAPALPRLRRQARWQCLLVFPWFVPMVGYWVVGPAYVGDLRTFSGVTLFNLALALLALVLVDLLIQGVIRCYPGLDQTRSRVSRMLIITTFVTTLFCIGCVSLYSTFHWFGAVYTDAALAKVLLLNLGANFFSVGIDETYYSLTKWRENAMERERLQQENLQSQYESLKNQVNPHFLFNSLNSLSSLIADDPEQAEIFVDEMANVYRYLLQTNRPPDGGDEGSEDCQLTTLRAELHFIDSYFHLLKTRYRTGINLLTDIPTTSLNHRLPPLTLQMLVENAVKHNVILASRPLMISISVSPVDGRLRVKNNLQPKTGAADRRLEAPGQVGLTNIAAKYRLLSQKEPVISKDDGFFSVTLPLIPPVRL